MFKGALTLSAAPSALKRLIDVESATTMLPYRPLTRDLGAICIARAIGNRLTLPPPTSAAILSPVLYGRSIQPLQFQLRIRSVPHSFSCLPHTSP